jgi:hypothetical protein
LWRSSKECIDVLELALMHHSSRYCSATVGPLALTSLGRWPVF